MPYELSTLRHAVLVLIPQLGGSLQGFALFHIIKQRVAIYLLYDIINKKYSMTGYRYNIHLAILIYQLMLVSDIVKVLTTYQTFLYFCRNLNMFIKKKLKYFTRPKQISPDLSGVSGDFRIVCRMILYADIQSNSTTPRRVALARMFKEAGSEALAHN